MAKHNFKKSIRQKRLGQWLRVNYKFACRKVRRLFMGDNFQRAVRGAFARRLYIAVTCGLVAILCVIGAHWGNIHGRDVEGMILGKLTYGPDYDTTVPYFRTLHAIGSSNHLCVTVKTGRIDNLSDRTPTLEDGGINLKLTFEDGSVSELPLLKKFRSDSFSSGKETNFIVTLPYGYTPFDITASSLTITPGSEGRYDDWLCQYATLSFMLGEERVLIAERDTPARLGSGANLLRSLDLLDKRGDNTTYQQTKLLFEKLLTLAENGMVDFTDSTLKKDTLESLGLQSATALYLDVETVSSGRNAELKNELGENSRLPEKEDLNYNGTLIACVTFHTKLPDGSYTQTYTLDTPGKDDFEMSGASTFRMDMPEGMCVFDVAEVSLTLSDHSDAWAPRFARLYLTLDYEKELELGRLTDSYLVQQYDTCIFYQGFLDAPITFDLTESHAIPYIDAAGIEKDYGHTLSGAVYEMYFEPQSYYSRQLRFYEQMDKLFFAEEIQ